MNRLLAFVFLCCVVTTAAATRRSASDELITHDRRLGTTEHTLGAAFGELLADDAHVLAWQRVLDTKRAALDAIAKDAALASVRVRWVPLRVGVSADGFQGYTLGHLVQTDAGGVESGWKYLAYWRRERDGVWRAVAWKQQRRAQGAADFSYIAPITTGREQPAASLDSHAAGVRAAEQAFSDEAQHAGIRAAARRYAHPNATHMGSPDAAGFLIGVENMVAGAPPGTRAPVHWSSDRVIVASSGDLAVSIGHITANASDAGAEPARFPFFTVWHREGPEQPWRFVAE